MVFSTKKATLKIRISLLEKGFHPIVHSLLLSKQYGPHLMGSSKGAGVVRFRIDPEKIGSALNFLMHYDGLRFIDVTLIGTLDVLIKNFFFSAIEFLQSNTFFENNICSN